MCAHADPPRDAENQRPLTPSLLPLARCLCVVADASLLPFLEQIDQIETNLTVLEQATKEIDDYSKRLEAKFKKVLGTK